MKVSSDDMTVSKFVKKWEKISGYERVNTDTVSLFTWMVIYHVETHSKEIQLELAKDYLSFNFSGYNSAKQWCLDTVSELALFN